MIVVYALAAEFDDEPHLVSVTRKLSNDFYYYNGSSGAKVCDNDLHINITYLVDDRLCVENNELFRRGKLVECAIKDITIVHCGHFQHVAWP